MKLSSIKPVSDEQFRVMVIKASDKLNESVRFTADGRVVNVCTGRRYWGTKYGPMYHGRSDAWISAVEAALRVNNPRVVIKVHAAKTA